MKIRLATGVDRRATGDLPEMRLLNMYVEATETEEEGVVLQSRPGLVPFRQLGGGTGSVEGLFEASDSIYAAVDADIYRDLTKVGTTTGAMDRVEWARSNLEVLVTRRGPMFSYNTTDFVAVTFPDGRSIASLAYLGGYFIAVPDDGSGQFYWSALLDGRSWDALDFATAESDADRVYEVRRVGDELWFLGARTIEIWAQTGNPDAPFQRIGGRNMPKGTLGRLSGTAEASAVIDGTLYWIGNDKCVYRASDGMERISTAYIEERIRAATGIGIRTFAFAFDHHTFYVLRLGGSGTFAFDVTTGRWTQFATFGSVLWEVRTAISRVEFDAAPTALFGMTSGGTICEMSATNYDDGSTLERSFNAFVQLDGSSARIDSVMLRADPGDGAVTGTISCRASYDYGETWSAYVAESLGAPGDYRHRVSWRRWGLFDPPGAMFMFRVIDPVPLRVTNASVNDARGGRGRP